jgi:hypothetical protein
MAVQSTNSTTGAKGPDVRSTEILPSRVRHRSSCDTVMTSQELEQRSVQRKSEYFDAKTELTQNDGSHRFSSLHNSVRSSAYFDTSDTLSGGNGSNRLSAFNPNSSIRNSTTTLSVYFEADDRLGNEEVDRASFHGSNRLSVLSLDPFNRKSIYFDANDNLGSGEVDQSSVEYLLLMVQGLPESLDAPSESPSTHQLQQQFLQTLSSACASLSDEDSRRLSIEMVKRAGDDRLTPWIRRELAERGSNLLRHKFDVELAQTVALTLHNLVSVGYCADLIDLLKASLEPIADKPTADNNMDAGSEIVKKLFYPRALNERPFLQDKLLSAIDSFHHFRARDLEDLMSARRVWSDLSPDSKNQILLMAVVQKEEVPVAAFIPCFADPDLKPDLQQELAGYLHKRIVAMGSEDQLKVMNAFMIEAIKLPPGKAKENALDLHERSTPQSWWQACLPCISVGDTKKWRREGVRASTLINNTNNTMVLPPRALQATTKGALQSLEGAVSSLKAALQDSAGEGTLESLAKDFDLFTEELRAAAKSVAPRQLEALSDGTRADLDRTIAQQTKTLQNLKHEVGVLVETHCESLLESGRLEDVKHLETIERCMEAPVDHLSKDAKPNASGR